MWSFYCQECNFQIHKQRMSSIQFICWTNRDPRLTRALWEALFLFWIFHPEYSSTGLLIVVCSIFNHRGFENCGLEFGDLLDLVVAQLTWNIMKAWIHDSTDLRQLPYSDSNLLENTWKGIDLVIFKFSTLKDNSQIQTGTKDVIRLQVMINSWGLNCTINTRQNSDNLLPLNNHAKIGSSRTSYYTKLLQI